MPENAVFSKSRKSIHHKSIGYDQAYELTIKKITIDNSGYYECHGRDENKNNFEARAQLVVPNKMGKLIENSENLIKNLLGCNKPQFSSIKM